MVEKIDSCLFKHTKKTVTQNNLHLTLENFENLD